MECVLKPPVRRAVILQGSVSETHARHIDEASV